MRRLTFAACLVVVLGGCSGSAHISLGTPELSKQTIETQTADQLAAQTNQSKPTVTCPGPLEAKVGKSIDCELVAQGDPTVLPVHIVIDSVTGSTAHFSISVGGAGDKTAFCNDNAALDKATSGSSGGGDLIAAFKANLTVLDDFEKTAPASISADAKTLAEAAKAAAAANDANVFLKVPVDQIGPRVDAFCGQNADGSPATTTTSAAP